MDSEAVVEVVIVVDLAVEADLVVVVAIGVDSVAGVALVVEVDSEVEEVDSTVEGAEEDSAALQEEVGADSRVEEVMQVMEIEEVVVVGAAVGSVDHQEEVTLAVAAVEVVTEVVDSSKSTFSFKGSC